MLSTLTNVWSVVQAYDSAPYYSRFEESKDLHPRLIICCLRPYSPMLNPIETICSKLNAEVKKRVRVPVATSPRLGEQLLVHVENTIKEIISKVSSCHTESSCQHSQGFWLLWKCTGNGRHASTQLTDCVHDCAVSYST